MASAHLSRTFDQVGNRTTWTLSVWIKRTGIGGQQNFFGSFPQSTDYERIMFNNDKIYIAEVAGGSTNWECETSAVYRDTSGWYHLVLRHDTTQATANDRIRLYMNGVQQTFATNTQPAQNRGTAINTADVHKIGMGNSSEYTDCIMAHFHWCDGQSYAPTEFGETDSTTGIWKPKTSPSVSYGTNGFFLKFDNSANMGLDSGGGSHNWTTNGTIIQAKDTPSNVFACLNRLQRYDDYNLTLINNRFTNTSAAAHRQVHSTLSALSGKYYAEVKVTTLGGTYPQIGVINPDKAVFTSYLGNTDSGYGYLSNGNKQYNNSAESWGDTYTTNDIIGIAMDLDNHKLYFSKNGTFQQSGDPTSGSTGTGAAYSLATGVFYSFGQSAYDSGTDPVYDWNFGNGYFGTTAVASAGTNASGNGVFEYDVPAGYTALSTKGLNT
tara:strand:- start:1477 stop:2787 length:1311 start_codon:yes stop_codon:yes gene_type:complete